MRWGSVAAMLVGVSAAAGLRAQGFATRLDGHTVTELAPAGTKAVVLYFVASDCPVSNRTMPEMLRIRKEFAERGVAFRFVYANTGETAQSVQQHVATYGAGLSAVKDVLLDKPGRLVELTRVRVTPEAAVLVREGSAWKTVYAGRVDNRYVRLDVERPQATEHYAEQVVAEVLAGRVVQAASGVPVGCAIVNPKAPATESEGR